MSGKNLQHEDVAFKSLQDILYNKVTNSASKLSQVGKLAGSYNGGRQAFFRARSSEGCPFLFIPVLALEPLLVKYFFDNGADPSATTLSEVDKKKVPHQCAFHFLIRAIRWLDPSYNEMKKAMEIGKTLAENGVDPNFRDVFYRTPLMYGLYTDIDFDLHNPLWGLPVRFKLTTDEVKRKLADMFNYPALDAAAEAYNRVRSSSLKPDEIDIDNKSSVAHIFYNFFHNEVKGFDPKQVLMPMKMEPEVVKQLLNMIEVVVSGFKVVQQVSDMEGGLNVLSMEGYSNVFSRRKIINLPPEQSETGVSHNDLWVRLKKSAAHFISIEEMLSNNDFDKARDYIRKMEEFAPRHAITEVSGEGMDVTSMIEILNKDFQKVRQDRHVYNLAERKMMSYGNLLQRLVDQSKKEYTTGEMAKIVCDSPATANTGIKYLIEHTALDLRKEMRYSWVLPPAMQSEMQLPMAR